MTGRTPSLALPLPQREPANRLTPSLAILGSTVLWGTLWIPLRHLNAAGSGGPWATAAGFFLPLLALLPFGLIRWRIIVAGGWPLARAGFLMAVCIALYAEALLRGYVARVILLFYLTPVWSTLLAWAVLAEAVTRARIVTVAVGLTGMFIVFGVGNGLPVPRSAAEWMGLLSGFCWGLSMVSLRRVAGAAEFDKVFVQFLFVGALFLLLTSVPGGRPSPVPPPETFFESASWLLLFGLVWMPVVLWLTMFGGSRLDPGRVAVLLMLEVVIGLVSAALLTDEPFGPREIVGAICIVAACGSEFFSANPAT
jgi:drug/metabolite transporter (DMT)-like permease